VLLNSIDEVAGDLSEPNKAHVKLSHHVNNKTQNAFIRRISYRIFYTVFHSLKRIKPVPPLGCLGISIKVGHISMFVVYVAT
jgi:hypothetical protein